MDTYVRRVVDNELDELTQALPAIVLEGAKGVGKTETAARRANTQYLLDKPAQFAVAQASPERLLEGQAPILIDEWQRLPESWDLVRREVDRDDAPGRFLLTGSATPTAAPSHSGAARIVTLRVRPLTLAERGIGVPTVSLGQLLKGQRPAVSGTTDVTVSDYADEIIASGFPGLRKYTGRALRAHLDGYIDRIIEHDFPEMGRQVRNPPALRRWMTAYASTVSTTAAYETIRDAATGGHNEKPGRPTVQAYIDILERLWILEPVPAWLPQRNHVSRLAAAAKHQLADPALAARLLKLDADALLSRPADGPVTVRDGTYLGALFESLVTLCVRVYAQAAEATVSHLRTREPNEHEIDLIVQRPDGRVLGIEVKLAQTVGSKAGLHLKWLKDRIGDELLDAVIITTGTEAYRRRDGIAVVPLALLGP